MIKLESVKSKLEERKRILSFLEPHLEKCNFKAVTEEDCDVCSWIADTVDKINNERAAP